MPKTVSGKKLILDTEYLEGVKDSALFYPCSGNDFETPIKLFAPYIKDFWFIDKCYFAGYSNRRGASRDMPSTINDLPTSAGNAKLVLSDNPAYTFLGKTIDGPPTWPRANPDIEPCVLTEYYEHRPTGKEIRIHRRRGYGFSAFRKHVWSGDMGVFFYRGDSPGEGGSGNLWLLGDHVDEILAELRPGGLLAVTGQDGAMHGLRSGFYRKYYFGAPDHLSPKERMYYRGSFNYKYGFSFHCVGYAGRGTMIWQMKHKNEEKRIEFQKVMRKEIHHRLITESARCRARHRQRNRMVDWVWD